MTKKPLDQYFKDLTLQAEKVNRQGMKELCELVYKHNKQETQYFKCGWCNTVFMHEIGKMPGCPWCHKDDKLGEVCDT